MVGTLNSATVGIQNATRLDGLNVAFNAAYLHNNMAIEFKSMSEWVLTAPNGGTIPAGTCATVTASFDATEPGSHSRNRTARCSTSPATIRRARWWTCRSR